MWAWFLLKARHLWRRGTPLCPCGARWDNKGGRLNLRIGEHSLRWRVTRAEVELLLSGRAVKLQVPLPRAHSFQAVVRVSELQALADALPTKEPIEHVLDVDGGELKLSFEVDVRDRKR
jgi:hypothetical protein